MLLIHVLGCGFLAALKLALLLRNLESLRKYQTIVCIGVVVRGDTTHYDAVANSTASEMLTAGINQACVISGSRGNDPCGAGPSGTNQCSVAGGKGPTGAESGGAGPSGTSPDANAGAGAGPNGTGPSGTSPDARAGPP